MEGHRLQQGTRLVHCLDIGNLEFKLRSDGPSRLLRFVSDAPVAGSSGFHNHLSTLVTTSSSGIPSLVSKLLLCEKHGDVYQHDAHTRPLRSSGLCKSSPPRTVLDAWQARRRVFPAVYGTHPLPSIRFRPFGMSDEHIRKFSAHIKPLRR